MEYSMCASSTGSVMGYDEVYPKLIELVHETRLYTSESSSNKPVTVGGGEGGIGGIKVCIPFFFEATRRL